MAAANCRSAASPLLNLLSSANIVPDTAAPAAATPATPCRNARRLTTDRQREASSVCFSLFESPETAGVTNFFSDIVRLLNSLFGMDPRSAPQCGALNSILEDYLRKRC